MWVYHHSRLLISPPKHTPDVCMFPRVANDRLSYANLLHPTPPAAAAAATGDAQATAGASGGATRTTSTGGASAKASEAGDARLDTPAKDGSQVAEDDDVQAAIKEAISDMVKQSELAPVARWAKIKDSADVPERKPVLNSVSLRLFFAMVSCVKWTLNWHKMVL
jgi:hypothetical protein